MDHFSPVESKFLAKQGLAKQHSKTPYLLVDNFLQLGMITALRFLEWVQENPEGVISLRYREAKTNQERCQKESIFMIDFYFAAKGCKIGKRLS